MRPRTCLTISIAVLAGLTLAVVAIGGPGDRAVGGISAGRADTGGGNELARQAAILEMEQARLRELRQACRDAGFTAEEFSRLMTLVTRAKLAGLPHLQLLNKLDEGIAKRAMPERVLDALEARARRLRDAKTLVDRLILQGWLAPDYSLAVALVADALGAGSSPAELERAVRDGEPGLPGTLDVRSAFVGIDRQGR